jgi:hypothetical protein
MAIMHHLRDEMIENGFVIQSSGRHIEYGFKDNGS